MSAARANAERIPVTVLTGYLGAGKTTLLNRIVSEDHGHRYAVIVNEFGEVGIDNDLILNTDEELFEMNNRCMGCSPGGPMRRRRSTRSSWKRRASPIRAPSRRRSSSIHFCTRASCSI